MFVKVRRQVIDMRPWLFPICNFGFKFTLRVFSRCVISGQEYIPKNGQLIFVSNHLSNLDPPILAAISNRAPRFLAKKELFSFSIMSFLLRSYGAFPVNRGKGDLRAINWAKNLMKDNNATLALFPEGTRDRNGKGLKPGQIGVAQIAVKSNAVLVPIGLTGTEKLQNVLRVFKPNADINIQIGTPFRIRGLKEDEITRQQLNKITTEIMIRIAKLLPKKMRGHYEHVSDNPFSYTKNYI